MVKRERSGSWGGLRGLGIALLLPLLVISTVGVRAFLVDLGRPAPTPDARWGAAMTYDAATHSVVLFGGHGQHGDLRDTWIWDGDRWTHVHTLDNPPAMVKPFAVYDPASRRVLAFDASGWPGGTSALSPEVWSWDGSTWTETWSRPWVADLPSVDRAPLMTADPSLNMLVARLRIKPFDVPGMSEWDGHEWTQRAEVEPPDESDEAVAMAWDPGGRRLVVLLSSIQGRSCGLADDVLVQPGYPAPARTPWSAGVGSSCAMFVPPAESAISVCHSKFASARLMAFALRPDGNDPIPTAGLPCGWSGEQLVSDPATDSVMVLGATAQWILHPNGWQRIAAIPALQARSGVAVADDPSHRDIVLFGGQRGGKASNDTWTWDGHAWHQRGGIQPPAPTPTPTSDTPRGRAGSTP